MVFSCLVYFQLSAYLSLSIKCEVTHYNLFMLSLMFFLLNCMIHHRFQCYLRRKVSIGLICPFIYTLLLCISFTFCLKWYLFVIILRKFKQCFFFFFFSNRGISRVYSAVFLRRIQASRGDARHMPLAWVVALGEHLH